MIRLLFDEVSVVLGNAKLLKNIDLKIGSEELVALVGPNGAGKTSLLQCAVGLQAPSSGSVTINGISASALTPLERARAISYLPQSSPLAWPIVVRDIVSLGRFAYGASLNHLKGEDHEVVERSIIDCDLSTLATRNADTLSGGELARVHFARALAAKSSYILADEPTAGLDPYHQFKILELLRRYVDAGGGALVVLHDISLAAQFADRIVWMKEAAIVADGSVIDTLTEQRMKTIYDVNATVRYDQETPIVTLRKAISKKPDEQNSTATNQ